MAGSSVILQPPYSDENVYGNCISLLFERIISRRVRTRVLDREKSLLSTFLVTNTIETKKGRGGQTRADWQLFVCGIVSVCVKLVNNDHVLPIGKHYLKARGNSSKY